MSYSEGLEALQQGAFGAAVPLLEQAATAADFASDTINDAYTLALYHAGERQRLADVAFLVGSRAAAKSPGLAMDFFQRALIAGLDSERIRGIGAFHEEWAGKPRRSQQSDKAVVRVAHVAGGLFVDKEPTRRIRLLCEGLRAHGAASAVFSTEWAASWFLNRSGSGHSDAVEIGADSWRAPLEGTLLDRAQAVANAVRAYDPQVVLYHAQFFEQVTARVAAFISGPLQVHVNHDLEITADLFDGRIHCSGRALARTEYPDNSAGWIPRVSDVESRLTKDAPIARRAIGIDSASSVSATFGHLDAICSPGYLAALTELLTRFPNHYHLFAGQGNVRAARQTLHAEGVLPRVRFLGPYGNVALLLPALDFYLAPFPHFDQDPVLDAMGAGKPVIVHRKAMDANGDPAADLVGSEEELVVDNQAGYVEAASRIIRKSALRETLSESMRQRFAANYSPAAMGKKFMDEFKKLAAR
jgi:glycosyltransferase involved in cell wall biosynthesis